MAKDNLINDWLENEISGSERLEMERIIALTENLDVPAQRTKAQAWDDLLSKIDKSGQSNERVLVPQSTSRRTWIGIAVSIAAVLIVGIYFLIPDNGVTLTTGTAQQEEFVLPDNSVVLLNANSSISYDKQSWMSNRSLELSGEAFFKVEPGSDFTVMTPKGQVQVVGTSFNVYSRNEILEVSCFEGKVNVGNSANSELITAGMKATIAGNSDRFDIGSFDPNQTATWRIGEFYFNEANLASVLKELERQFNITISISTNIEYRTYSGYFNNNNLIEALQLVLTPMGLQFEINDDQVTVQ